MSRVKTAFHDEISGVSEGEWERVADELMDDYLGLRIEISRLRTRLGDAATSAKGSATEALYVQFSEDGSAIRKWSREPFEGGTRFDCRGTFPPAKPDAHTELDKRVRVERTCTGSNDWTSV